LTGALALSLGFVLFLAAGGLVLRYQWRALQQVQQQYACAHRSLFTAQQLALHLQLYLRQKQNPALLTALTETHRQQLQVLAQGGRWPETNILLNPLGRLPKISLDEIARASAEFNASIQIVATHQLLKDSTQTVPQVDSLSGETYVTVKVANTDVARAYTLLDGQWLTLQAKYDALLNDLQWDIGKRQENFLGAFIGLGITCLAFVAITLWLFRQKVMMPLHIVQQAAASGTHTAPMAGEAGTIGESLNALIDQLHHASDFVESIGEGKLDVALSEVQQQRNDKLAQSLNAMKDKLRAMNEEEQKRQWANEGLTRFVEIVRSANDNLNTLGDKIISALVRYTRANQGGLYVLNDDDPSQKYLELISLFAFNTKKYEQQKLKPGEGLAGQCYLERETIFLTEIPSDFVRITSGLGDAAPNSLLIVPLKVDKEIFGVVELASFQVFQAHEIAFVEKLAETIASTISTVKANEKNRKLLETFQEQTEQMRAQEEEMRQNMEELTATQEEMARKEKDYILRISELESQKPQTIKGDDWAAAEQMEHTLRLQLEALDIATRASRT